MTLSEELPSWSSRDGATLDHVYEQADAVAWAAECVADVMPGVVVVYEHTHKVSNVSD